MGLFVADKYCNGITGAVIIHCFSLTQSVCMSNKDKRTIKNFFIQYTMSCLLATIKCFFKNIQIVCIQCIYKAGNYIFEGQLKQMVPFSILSEKTFMQVLFFPQWFSSLQLEAKIKKNTNNPNTFNTCCCNWKWVMNIQIGIWNTNSTFDSKKDW